MTERCEVHDVDLVLEKVDVVEMPDGVMHERQVWICPVSEHRRVFKMDYSFEFEADA